MGVFKEDVLRKFTVLIRYDNPSCEETAEIEASNSSSARAICRSIFESHESKRAEMESKNVYASRRMVSCSLVPKTWRQQMQFMKFLEGDV